MTTKEQIEKAYQLLKDRWSEQGSCESCGWHGLLEEHCFDDVDISTALDNDKMLHLSCVSKDDEDADFHRGVKVNLI